MKGTSRGGPLSIMADSAGRACRMQLLRVPKSGCGCRSERAARSCHVLSWGEQGGRRKLLPVFVVDLALIIPRCARPFWSFGPATSYGLALHSTLHRRASSQDSRQKAWLPAVGCPYMPDGSCVCRVRCDAATTLSLTTTEALRVPALASPLPWPTT